jgi:hypothetical protein
MIQATALRFAVGLFSEYSVIVTSDSAADSSQAKRIRA